MAHEEAAEARERALQQRVEELETDRKIATESRDYWREAAKLENAAGAAAEARERGLREALKPFAERASRYDEIPGLRLTHDDVELWQQNGNADRRVDITVGHLRVARAALSAHQEPDHEGK
jgi:hypothetical protein